MKNKKQFTKHISFSESTYNDLIIYIDKNFNNKPVISAIVDKAVSEYLEKRK